MSLRAHAIQGVFWNVGMAAASEVMTAIGQIVLACLLLPANIGLASLALAEVAFSGILSADGIRDILIQRGLYDEESGQGMWIAFFSNVIVGLLLAASTFADDRAGNVTSRNLFLILAFTAVAASSSTVLAKGLKAKLDFKGIDLLRRVDMRRYSFCAGAEADIMRTMRNKVSRDTGFGIEHGFKRFGYIMQFASKTVTTKGNIRITRSDNRTSVLSFIPKGHGR